MTPKISYSGYPLQQQTESVILYEDTTYQGASQTLKIGQYDVHQLSLGNDQLSSILVPQGMRVRLFEHAGFQGTFREITADTPDLGAQWNDRVSSLWVYSEAYTNVCVSTNTAPACGYEPEWQIFDDFNEPLSDSQWTQSISGTAIINAGAGILALDASAATGPYTYPRYAVVNSTQEFTSGAFRFVGIQEEVDRLWFVGLDNGQGTYILVRRDHPENRNLEFAVYSNDEMIDLIFFDPPIQPPIIEEITILWSDYSVDVVVKVDGQTQYTHHVDLPGILAPMPISTGAYTSTRLIIDDIFISEYALEER
jgi:hypothetical protein